MSSLLFLVNWLEQKKNFFFEIIFFSLQRIFSEVFKRNQSNLRCRKFSSIFSLLFFRKKIHRFSWLLEIIKCVFGMNKLKTNHWLLHQFVTNKNLLIKKTIERWKKSFRMMDFHNSIASKSIEFHQMNRETKKKKIVFW